MNRCDHGFSLAEVLIAAAVLAMGFAGVVGMLALSSYGIREGRYRSMAVVLADERVEQVRAARWDGSEDCLGISPSPVLPPVTSGCSGTGAGYAPFPDEAPGTMPGPFEQFGRAVRIHTCAGTGVCSIATADLRLVTVAVVYSPTSGLGGNVSGIEQSMVVSRLVGRKR